MLILLLGIGRKIQLVEEFASFCAGRYANEAVSRRNTRSLFAL